MTEAEDSYTTQLMTIADFDEVTELWRNTDGIGVSESDAQSAIAFYLERNPGLSRVIRRNKEIVATILCGHDGRRGYLYHLAVAALHRKKGLGKKLVAECLADLERLGIRRCNILVFTDNADGEAFWLHHGWTKRTNVQLFQKKLAPAGGSGCDC
jgi:N-acetylglutamate synthase